MANQTSESLKCKKSKKAQSPYFCFSALIKKFWRSRLESDKFLSAKDKKISNFRQEKIVYMGDNTKTELKIEIVLAV